MEGVDRLNELTDEMLVNNIMSRLDCTTKELIRTTATISKRWKNLWTQLPRLIFSYHDGHTYFEKGRDTDLCDYISIIDNTLNQCPANLNLKKFELYIRYNSKINSEFKSQANSWIRYAISRNVEDVDLRLLDMDVYQDFTYDDELFFNNLCFNRVKVSYGEFKPPNGLISWERLEWLGLFRVTLDEDMIEKILSGSPCLESLELINCHGYKRIDVASRSVKKLVVSDYYDWSEEGCIKINAPYISSLTIKGKFELELVLLDVSSLIKAELDCRINPGMYDDITYEEMLRGILESLDHVKDVIINDFWWELVMEGADRLNELTDEMLVNNIMSRLDCTTKELIRTTATISKRWRNLWTQLPRLIFSYHDGHTYFEKGHDTDLFDYMSIIDNTLNQCPANLNLKKFELYIRYNSKINSEFKSHANSWIRYAISRNVEDVDLWLPGMDVDKDFTYDDELFFNNLCFNRVKVSYGEFNPPNGAISWERLECLCLSYVVLDEDMIEKILSGSPCLESLKLKNCHGYKRIDVTSRSVKKLVFFKYYCWSEEDYME